MSFWKRRHSPEECKSLSDEDLCCEVAAGSQEAFLLLFDRYWKQVFRLAFAVVRDEAEAEDLAQSLFLEFHKSMLLFDSKKGSFRTRILRYAYTRAIDQRRRLQSRQFYSHIDLEDVDQSRLANDSLSLPDLSPEEGTRLIEQAMKRLDDKQRATVEAYFFRGLSLNEIAAELGESFGNTRHHLYRGLERMRRLIETKEKTEESEEQDRSIGVRLRRKMPKGFAPEVSGD